MRGNPSELVPVSCKLPLKQFNVKRVHLWYSITLDDEISLVTKTAWTKEMQEYAKHIAG